ncbi:MAG TPA: OsmC family peroxiredoxin [Actinomycetota bacterium]|nr:OsmC family peroxiredoxin [Actinomycetota bacterium]
MAAERTARSVWQGDLQGGSGEVSTETSSVLQGTPVSWAARTEDAGGKTSPEELLAAAHAACFNMALSGALARAGTPPERLETTATTTFDKVGDKWKVTTAVLRVRGRVPGVDQAAFEEAARGAGEGCPISGALKGNVDISVTAELESS